MNYNIFVVKIFLLSDIDFSTHRISLLQFYTYIDNNYIAYFFCSIFNACSEKMVVLLGSKTLMNALKPQSSYRTSVSLFVPFLYLYDFLTIVYIQFHSQLVRITIRRQNPTVVLAQCLQITDAMSTNNKLKTFNYTLETSPSLNWGEGLRIGHI